jgi:hypothetical protein
MAREIKVFCNEHQATFDVEVKPQLVCEIREHSLSIGFPHSEFWQYCCDCQTFSLSDFETGGTTKAECVHCERKTTRFFVCASCKTVCYDSDEDTRGKKTSVSFINGIKPNCPACENTSNGRLFQHSCDSVKAIILTTRLDCSFCQKSAEIKKIEPIVAITHTESAIENRCTMCFTPREIDANCCTECGMVFDSTSPNSQSFNQPLSKPDFLNDGLGQPQIVHSNQFYCPKCGGKNLVGSEYCADCGVSLDDKSEIISTNTKIDPRVYLGGGIVGIIIILVALIAINSSRSQAVMNRSSNAASNTKTASVSITPNKQSSDFRIGKKGTLNMDANLRKFASKDAEWLGTHYRSAKIEILDADNSGSQTWYKIKVISFGTSMTTGSSGKDPNSEDVGWVNSFPLSNDGRTRADLISFESDNKKF